MAGAGCRRAGRERAGRRAWPARPASWALGRRRRPGGTPGLPSRRPALGPAPGLCHCPCPGARGARAARPRGAPRRGVIRPGRGLAPCASGSRRRPQAGRARWASATERARWGRGASGRGRRRGDVSARPAPSDPALGAERRVPPPAERGGCAAAAATSFPPRRPGSLSPCRRSRCLGLGRPGGARQGLCKFERLRDVTSRPGMSRPFGPGLGAFAALAPVPVEGEQGRRRATRAGRPDYPGHQVGRPDQPLWQDPWSSAVNVPLGLAVLPRSPHISGVAFVRFNTVVQCLELRFLYPLPPSSASFLQCGQWEVLLVPDYGARKCSLS